MADAKEQAPTVTPSHTEDAAKRPSTTPGAATLPAGAEANKSDQGQTSEGAGELPHNPFETHDQPQAPIVAAPEPSADGAGSTPDAPVAPQVSTSEAPTREVTSGEVESETPNEAVPEKGHEPPGAGLRATWKRAKDAWAQAKQKARARVYAPVDEPHEHDIDGQYALPASEAEAAEETAEAPTAPDASAVVTNQGAASKPELTSVPAKPQAVPSGPVSDPSSVPPPDVGSVPPAAPSPHLYATPELANLALRWKSLKYTQIYPCPDGVVIETSEKSRLIDRGHSVYLEGPEEHAQMLALLENAYKHWNKQIGFEGTSEFMLKMWAYAKAYDVEPVGFQPPPEHMAEVNKLLSTLRQTRAEEQRLHKIDWPLTRVDGTANSQFEAPGRPSLKNPMGEFIKNAPLALRAEMKSIRAEVEKELPLKKWPDTPVYNMAEGYNRSYESWRSRFKGTERYDQLEAESYERQRRYYAALDYLFQQKLEAAGFKPDPASGIYSKWPVPGDADFMGPVQPAAGAQTSSITLASSPTAPVEVTPPQGAPSKIPVPEVLPPEAAVPEAVVALDSTPQAIKYTVPPQPGVPSLIVPRSEAKASDDDATCTISDHTQPAKPQAETLASGGYHDAFRLSVPKGLPLDAQKQSIHAQIVDLIKHQSRDKPYRRNASMMAGTVDAKLAL